MRRAFDWTSRTSEKLRRFSQPGVFVEDLQVEPGHYLREHVKHEGVQAFLNFPESDSSPLVTSDHKAMSECNRSAIRNLELEAIM